MDGFMVGPVDGEQVPQLKGRGSLAADRVPLKRFVARSDIRGPAKPTPAESSLPYPQNLWISLWSLVRPEAKFPHQIAYLLPWRKIDQVISPLLFNELGGFRGAGSVVSTVICSFAGTAPAACA